ncbi:serine hydrolase domain-containing protein [Amycolatopsis endophytica]|uniref:CubicO group peptidase (Beta-lactamase class C family) n=1 Tax=Amycolatopsis endophytica TaxID=860233 RepID=A0A853BF78_9PSEU|nr:serine hydrolase domain-containing protein [Amycolatopsis endophytica]NYI93146.1 CubicO group peptidase (beta-lactamase class C family) [Amycolatopsis endophytica]
MNGTCDERFAALGDLLERRLRTGEEAGASVCVIQDGAVLVDLWGGTASPGVPWTRDTLVNTYSLTKTVTALVALLLTGRGELDPDAPVARYWPEFGAAGKEDVLVRHVLGHTAGLCTWRETVALEDLYDTERAAALLAAQEPWWKPGDGSGYHAVSHGHLVGEIVRRVTGRTVGAVLRAEFPEADYWIGAPPEIDSRVATLVPPPSSGVDYAALAPVAVRTLTNPLIPPPVTTTRPFLAAELGGLNGQGNARSVARLQSLVSHRELSAVDRIFDVQADGVDRVLGAAVRFGLGYAVHAEKRICWWSGFGGSLVINDLDRRLTFAYVMNRMEPGLIGAPNTRAWAEALSSCL